MPLILRTPYGWPVLGLCLLLLVAPACKSKKKDDPAPASSPASTLSYTFGGTAYSATTAGYIPSTTLISAQIPNKHSLGISFDAAPTVGTFPLRKGTIFTYPNISFNRNDLATSVLNVPTWASYAGPAATNGKLVIMQAGGSPRRLKGTFTLTGGATSPSASGTVSITNGTFDLAY